MRSDATHTRLPGLASREDDPARIRSAALYGVVVVVVVVAAVVVVVVAVVVAVVIVGASVPSATALLNASTVSAPTSPSAVTPRSVWSF
jgi:hypothetical protein